MFARRGRGQAGFSLIEIVLVTAISGMLAAAAVAGFSQLRGQAQFSDSVERLKEKVLSVREEALATVKLSGGNDPTRITLGRILTFTPGSSTVKVQTLVTANNSAPSSGQAVSVLASETTNYTMPWGVTYLRSSLGTSRIQVAFVRSATDGTLRTAVSPNGGWSGWATGNYSYGNFVPNGAAVNINLQDPSARKAHLTIDPASNGVTRAYP